MKYVIRRYEIKICGLTRREDVLAAAEAGADYVGFVLVPSSKRYVAPERLAELTKDLPAHVRKVGVFADASLENILASVKAGALDIVQLHGNEAPEYAEQLKSEGLRVWKAAHLRQEADVDFYADYPAERIVADAAEGGSGKRSSWELAAKLARRKCVMLAGGITPENASEALEKVNPAGLDLASGVEEAPGIKSKEKITMLFNHIREAE